MRSTLAACAIGLSFFATASTPYSAEQCEPTKFLLNENTDFSSDDVLRLAFIETMTSSQFEDAKKKFSGGASFPINGIPISGYSNLESAKAAGRAEASARQFNLDSNQSRRLIANKVSATGSEAYLNCLRNQSAGIVAWVEEEAGALVKVGVIFRPRGEDQKVRPFGLENFTMISKLDRTFIPQDPQHLLFKRRSNAAGAIELRIGRESTQILFPPIPKLISFTQDTHVSSEVAAAETGGCKTCVAHTTVQACTRAPAGGWKFLPETAAVAGVSSSTPANTYKVDSATPELVCWSVTAATGDWRVVSKISARASIRIQRPTPASPQ